MEIGGGNWTGSEDSLKRNRLILGCLSNIFSFGKWGEYYLTVLSRKFL